MKRFLHAGEGYVLFKRPSFKAIPCSSDTTLADNKRYRNKTTSTAYGSLVRPWFRQAAGILLVALVCSINKLRSCNFSVLRTSCIYLGLFFMCLQAVIAKEPPVPETDRAVLVASSFSPDSIQPLQIGDALPLSFWQDFYGSVSLDSPAQLPVVEDINSKLVVIYFWSPLCKPCVESLRKLDYILSNGIEQLVVLPVLTHTPLELAQRYAQKHQFKTPFIITDGLLNKTYLSNYLPAWGGAWFYKGKLIAVPDLSGYTLEHVLKVLNGEDAEDQRGYPLGIASLIITD